MEDDLVFNQLQQDMPSNQIDDNQMPQANQETQEDFVRSSKFSVSYYRQFFNVDTTDVIQRILMGINPLDKKFFTTANPPDLYGPIWVTVSVCFIALLFGNLSAWIQLGSEWHFSFSRFVSANIFAFLFVFGAPFGWRSLTKRINPPSTISAISMFGYNLAICIFASILCLMVGRNADFLFSIVAGALAGFAFYRKLNAAFDASDQLKAFVPNVIMAVLLGLDIVIIQRIVH